MWNNFLKDLDWTCANSDHSQTQEETQNSEIRLETVERSIGKGTNAGEPAFSSCPRFFQKVSLASLLKLRILTEWV